MSRMHQSKTYTGKQLTFGVTVCFLKHPLKWLSNFNVSQQNTSCLAPIRTRFFVSCPRLDATNSEIKLKFVIS